MRTKLLSTITLMAAMTVGLSACGDLDRNDDELRAVEPAPSDAEVEFEPANLPEQTPPPASVDAPDVPEPPAAAPAPMAQDWVAWMETEVERAQTEAPEWYAHVMAMGPRPTRSGFLRFVGPELENANAAPVLLYRYTTGTDDVPTKAALVAALERTGGDYAPALVELMASESEPVIRVGMVAALKRADGPVALQGLELALGDADVDVRTAAAFNIGMRADGAELTSALTAALDDDAPQVVAASARALGFVHAEGVTDELAALLTSGDAEVRLRSLQAIDRIDPAYAGGLDLAPLMADDDAKVARAASKIASR